MKILIIRPWPSLLDVTKNTYNIQEVGLAKALVKRGHSTDILFWTDGDEMTVEVEAEGGKPILVDFWAPWCGPCMRQAPILEELAGEGYHIGKVDVDQAPDLAGNYRVMSIPTLILFKNGEEVKRFVGLQTKDTLKALLDAE